MRTTILLYTLTQLFNFSYSQINLNNGLVANYQFSGNANDSSIYLNNGIVNGAVLVNDRNGNPNSAYYFDGIDDFITVNANSNLSASNYELSISLWVKLTAYSSSQNKEAYILEKKSNNTSSNWGIKYFDKDANPAIEQLRFGGPLFTPWGSGGGTNTIIGFWSSTIPQLNTWYHIVVNHNLNNNQEIFINGVSESIVGNGGNTTSFWQNTANLIIGKATDNSSFFNGTIDDIRIYNRILTNNEITYLFNGTVLSTNSFDELMLPIIFPNPSQNYIYVNTNNTDEISTYEIYDIMGKSIISKTFKQNEVNISSLENGIYFIKLNNKNGKSLTKKFVKE